MRELQNDAPIPDWVASSIKGIDGADLVIHETTRMLQNGMPPKLDQSIVFPDIVLTMDGKEMRPSDRLSYDKIDLMLESGPVIFATEMKRSQVARVFSEGRFTVNCPTDEVLEKVVQAALTRIMPKAANDLTWSMFAYGTAFAQKVWDYTSGASLGLEDVSEQFYVPKTPKFARPSTIAHIRRYKKGGFNGFEQNKREGIGYNTVKRDDALVVPLNGWFGNLWGTSFLKPMYPLWVWFEVFLRAMSRYMERMATPVVLGRAPQTLSVKVDGRDKPVKALDLVLAVASNAGKSNAVAIPSDRDDNGNYIWDIGYLQANEGSQPFLNVLEYFGQEIIRASLTADNSVAKSSGGVGSYNIGEIHAQASSLTSELILIQILYYLNEYFMPDIALHNRGVNGPPIWLTTQPIDNRERDLLMKLLNVAGNTAAGEEFYEMLDWRSMAETSNVPTMSDDEVQSRIEDRFERGLDHQKRQNELFAEQQQAGQNEQNEKGQATDNGNLPNMFTPKDLVTMGAKTDGS